MAASVRVRPYERDLGMVMREVDENLAIFLGLRNGEEDKDGLPLIEDSHEFDLSKEREPISSLMPKASSETLRQNVADDGFFDLEIDMSDYDWLVPQRESNGEVDSPKPELAESSALMAKTSSADTKRRPSSSGERKPTPRAPTPTERRPMKSKPSHASTPSSSRPTLVSSRAALATSKTTLTSSTKPQTRSSTPSKPTITLTKSSASDSDRSSSGRKTGPTILKNPVPSRRASQTVKPRPSQPSAMISLSHEATEIPKTSLPKRPASASRGRRLSATATSSNGKQRQKSCSPAKVRAPNGNAVKNRNVIMLSRSRGYSNDDDDDVNPVLMGTKMVERVVNMRKLAPPKQDDYVPIDKSTRKSSMENSGFGRSLSKKSLDMAIRHMDIRRSIPDNLRPIAAVLSSSDCGIQSYSSKSSRVSASESTLTSGSDSSKSSNGDNSYFLNGRQMDD